MATFQTRVGYLIGSTASNTAQITEFLKEGVIDVTNRIIKLAPQEAIHFQAESAEQTSNGSYTVKGNIVSVVREAGTNNDWRDCRFIAPTLQSRVTDPESIHYASKYSPAYTLLDNGKISVFPAPGSNPDAFKVYFINTDPKRDSDAANLAYDSEDIRFFPKDKVHLVVIYAAVRYLMNELGATSLISDLPALVLDSFSDSLNLPSTPVLPVLSDTTISFTATAPTYSKPVVALEGKPTIEDLVITAVPPVAPSITASSVSFSTAVPTYTAPVLAPDFSDADANWITVEEDAELSTAKVNVINAEIAKYQADIQNQMNVFNKEAAEYNAQLQLSIQDAQLSQQDTGADLQKFANEVQNYTQKVATEVSQYQQNTNKTMQLWTTATGNALQQYGSDLQNAINVFNKENVEYQAQLQVSLQQGQLSQADDNKKVQDYQGKIQAYTQEVNTEVSRYKSELEKIVTMNQNKIAVYQSEVQDFMNRVQRDQVDYGHKDSRLLKLREEYNSAFAIMAPPQQKGER